jgi:hypothetical protein
VIRRNVAPEILQNNAAFCAKPPVDERSKFRDALKVELFVEHLVDQANDAALLEKPDLYGLQQCSNLVKVSTQVGAVNMENRFREAHLSVKDFQYETVAQHDECGVDVGMSGIFDGLGQGIVTERVFVLGKRPFCFDQPEIFLPEVEFVVREPFLAQEFNWPA